MNAARSSGSKIVAGAVALTCGAVGVGTIYLPFIADRDQMRGMHEEEAPPTSAMLVQEIRKLQKEGLLKGDEEHDVNIPSASEQKQGGLAPGSMWKRFK